MNYYNQQNYLKQHVKNQDYLNIIQNYYKTQNN